MSKKYVPRFLKNQDDSLTDSVMFTTGKSIVYSSGYSKNDTMGGKPLVNTSLPAKEAPSLVPGTLASLTSNGDSSTANTVERSYAYKPRSKAANVNLSSDQDFPSLGGVAKKQTEESVAAKPSFASMAKDWAKKQKEEEEMQKKEAEKNALIEAERRKKEKEDRSLLSSINSNLSKLLNTKTVDDDDIGKYESDHVDDDYSSTSEEETYEEEEDTQEYVDDDAWNKRRNKHDMY
jgi:hypothetical protein